MNKAIATLVLLAAVAVLAQARTDTFTDVNWTDYRVHRLPDGGATIEGCGRGVTGGGYVENACWPKEEGAIVLVGARRNAVLNIGDATLGQVNKAIRTTADAGPL